MLWFLAMLLLIANNLESFVYLVVQKIRLSFFLSAGTGFLEFMTHEVLSALMLSKGSSEEVEVSVDFCSQFRVSESALLSHFALHLKMPFLILKDHKSHVLSGIWIWL